MIKDGNATVFITDMDRAIAFYTETLALKLSSRYENLWATVDAGPFTIGLHPVDPRYPAPGTKGSIVIGLHTDEDLDHTRTSLLARGVLDLSEVTRGDGGNFLHLQDPDGNQLYLWQMPGTTPAQEKGN